MRFLSSTSTLGSAAVQIDVCRIDMDIGTYTCTYDGCTFHFLGQGPSSRVIILILKLYSITLILRSMHAIINPALFSYS